jgi:hypothetical protein
VCWCGVWASTTGIAIQLRAFPNRALREKLAHDVRHIVPAME